MAILCCKDCNMRHPYCHSECEEYIRQKADHDRRKAEYEKDARIAKAIMGDRGRKVYNAKKCRRYKNV